MKLPATDTQTLLFTYNGCMVLSYPTMSLNKSFWDWRLAISCICKVLYSSYKTKIYCEHSASGSYRLTGLHCHPPHCISSAVIADRDWNYFTRAAGLCLLALVSDLGLLRVLAGLGSLALLHLLGTLALAGELILLLLETRMDCFKLMDIVLITWKLHINI